VSESGRVGVLCGPRSCAGVETVVREAVAGMSVGMGYTDCPVFSFASSFGKRKDVCCSEMLVALRNSWSARFPGGARCPMEPGTQRERVPSLRDPPRPTARPRRRSSWPTARGGPPPSSPRPPTRWTGRFLSIPSASSCPIPSCPIHPSSHQFVHPSRRPSIDLSVYPYISPSVYRTVVLYICLYDCLSICPSIHIHDHIHIRMSIHPYFCPSIHQSILRHPMSLQLQWFETMRQIAAEKNSTIIVPDLG